MNKKLFYILLTVLTGYGLTMSTLTHGIGVRESIFFFFNMGAEVVAMPIILFFSLFGSPNPNFANASVGYVYVLANLLFWSPIAFAISSCFSKEKKFLPKIITTKYKILIISVILVVFVFIPLLLFSGQPPSVPQTVTIDMPSGVKHAQITNDSKTPIIALDCPITHTWNIESQRCDIMWNSVYVVVPIMIIIISIAVIVPIAIFKYRRRY